MTGDMVVALGSATRNGTTLFGQNCHSRVGQRVWLTRTPARPTYEPLLLHGIAIPPARQIHAVQGVQVEGAWGFLHGLNEPGVVAGVSTWDSAIQQSRATLSGTELVRLVLERSRTAQQALELLVDLISRHGQSSGEMAAESGRDCIFLLADRQEAYVVEAAGSYWAWQEVCQARAVSDVGIIRQDWNRLAPGLYEHASQQGWCLADGNKLDFAQAVSLNPVGHHSALRRWGRATFLLEQQQGSMDVEFVRRLLADHYEGARCEADPLTGTRVPIPLCRHAFLPTDLQTVASLIVEMPADRASPVRHWCAFGPPCLCLYFPVFFEGAGDPVFQPSAARGSRSEVKTDHGRRTANPGLLEDLFDAHASLLRHADFQAEHWLHIRGAVAQLQAQFDQEVEEWTGEVAELRRRGEQVVLERLTSSLMETHRERFQTLLEELCLQESAGREQRAEVEHQEAAVAGPLLFDF